MQFCRGGKAMPLKDAMEQFQDEFLSIQKVGWKKIVIRYEDFTFWIWIGKMFDQTRCSDISCWNLKDALFCISCRCFFGEKM